MDSWLLMMVAFVAVVSPAIFQVLSGSGRAEQAFSVSGRASPALPGSSRAEQAFSVSGRASPALPGSGRAEQAFSVSGRASPALPGSGRAEQAFSVSDRAAPALSGSGSRRLLMTDYSKPTAPAPAHSPNNPMCTNCCPQKTSKVFTLINKVFGWIIAIYLVIGVSYFIYCLYWSFKDLPNLPKIRVYSHLEEEDIERLQNVAAAGGLDRPTEEQLRAATRTRTQLDVHMDKHNTDTLVWLTAGGIATTSQRFRDAYDHSTSWMILIGKPFLACYLALKFAWPAFQTLGAPAWVVGVWLF